MKTVPMYSLKIERGTVWCCDVRLYTYNCICVVKEWCNGQITSLFCMTWSSFKAAAALLIVSFGTLLHTGKKFLNWWGEFLWICFLYLSKPLKELVEYLLWISIHKLQVWLTYIKLSWSCIHRCFDSFLRRVLALL